MLMDMISCFGRSIINQTKLNYSVISQFILFLTLLLLVIVNGGCYMLEHHDGPNEIFVIWFNFIQSIWNYSLCI